MLNKKFRFHSRGGVRYVYQHGKTIRDQQMSLVFMPNSKGFTRVAVVVSKKVEKSAVGRNRIRRRIYEALRKNWELVPGKTDYIFVVYSKEIMRMPFSGVEEILGKLVEESKVCYNKKNG
ncbi:ribonuclease P protein component [Candidatus Saccharibacteria bacterium]|nr:ribonuclease P protein component [Candidatus Saccharibacteria bacterium]MBR2708902.1 ribonuclease P protein component [Candidatus Saccharibacteria bacterium]